MFEGYTLFLLLSLPALALGIWAQFKVRSAFNKNAEIRTSTGMTGAQVARRVLDINGHP
jgi:Zn-dependent membrane protease YugP